MTRGGPRDMMVASKGANMTAYVRAIIEVPFATLREAVMHQDDLSLALLRTAGFAPSLVGARVNTTVSETDETEDLRRDLAALRFAEREWRERAHDLEREKDEAVAQLAEAQRVPAFSPSLAAELAAAYHETHTDYFHRPPITLWTCANPLCVRVRALLSVKLSDA